MANNTDLKLQIVNAVIRGDEASAESLMDELSPGRVEAFRRQLQRTTDLCEVRLARWAVVE